MRFRQAENGEAIYRNIRKKILQKGNFARRFLIMFQVAEGKLPADCVGWLSSIFSNKSLWRNLFY